jgi:hypothetical protein
MKLLLKQERDQRRASCFKIEEAPIESVEVRSPLPVQHNTEFVQNVTEET